MDLFEDVGNISVQTAAEDLPHRFLKYLVKRLNSAGIKVDEARTFDLDNKRRGSFKVPNLLDGIVIRTHDERSTVQDNKEFESTVHINIKLIGMKIQVKYEIYNNPVKINFNVANMSAKEVVDQIISNYEPSLKKIDTSRGEDPNLYTPRLEDILEQWNDNHANLITLKKNTSGGFYSNKRVEIDVRFNLIFKKNVDTSKYTSKNRLYRIIFKLLDNQGMKRRIGKDNRIDTEASNYYFFNLMITKALAMKKEIIRELSKVYDYLRENGIQIANYSGSYDGVYAGITLYLKKENNKIEKQSNQKTKSKSQILLSINEAISRQEEYINAQKERINKHIAEHGRYALKIFFKDPEKYI